MLNEIVEELCSKDAEHNSENSDVNECEIPKPSLSNLCKVCAKIRDIQNQMLYNFNGDIFTNVSWILLTCEDEVFKSKLKNLTQTNIDNTFKKL